MSSESMRGRLVEYQGMSWEVYGEGDRVSGERVVYLKNPVNDSVMVPLADVTLVQRQKSEGGRPAMSSIVDAARLMIERYGPSDTTDPTGHTWCGGCGNLIGVPYPCSDQIEHGDGCPSVALPKIVAALEAAEAYLAPGSEGGGSLARLLALEAAMTAAYGTHQNVSAIHHHHRR